MVTTISIVLLTTAVCHVIGNPVETKIRIPPGVASNPYDVNQLNFVHNKRSINNTIAVDKSLNYIDKTVKEVEAILNANASLPRLTRGEILEIIENITKADLAATQKQKNIERTQKAVMLVMPYTPNNDDDGKMQELYTKPPVTKIINDSSNLTTAQVKSTRKPQQKPQGTFRGEVFLEPFQKVPENKPGETPNIKANKIFLPTLRPVVYTQTPLLPKASSTQSLIVSQTTKNAPQYIDKVPYRKYRTSSQSPLTTSTEISVKTNFHTNIIRRRRPTQHPERHANHKYPEETSSISSNIISFPATYTTSKPGKFTYQTVAEAKPSRPHRFTTAKPLLLDVPLPDELRSTLNELNVGDSFSKNPVRYNFFNLPGPGDNVAINYDLPPVKYPAPDISVVADTLTPDMKELLMNFGLLTDTNQAATSVQEDPFIGASTAEVSPDSYVQFKPLPDIGQPSKEMEEFLGRFGLGKSTKNNREQKQYVQDPKSILNEAPEVEFEMLPDSLRDTIKDLGFLSREGKKVRNEETLNAVNKPNDDLNKPKKQHVFNPMETPYASQDEIDKLNQLMDIIKQLEKLNGTADDLNQINIDHINELVSSLNTNKTESLDKQEGGPNPINFDGGLAKNEIKRQENSTTSTPAPTTITTSVPVSTISEESQSSNIRDLEDSFGGSANGEPEVTVTIPPPTEPPKTGFYYLLDWNSFLDIDDQKGKRVNLRFQPKTGNPRDFIAVSVP